MIITKPKKSLHYDSFIKEVDALDPELDNILYSKTEDDLNYFFHFSRELTEQEILLIEQAYLAHDSSVYSPYAVTKLIDKQFIDRSIDKINFRDHLKINIKLSKSLINKPNGRPDVKEYTYNDEKIARRRWEFDDFSGGLYMEKRVYMAYYKENGTLGEEFLIEKDTINPSIANQLNKSIKERIDARDSIVGEIKATCSGALTVVLGKTMAEVVALIQPFWNYSEQHRRNFIELATHDWRDYIASSQSSIDYEWLDTPINAQGVTAKQYMLIRLGY